MIEAAGLTKSFGTVRALNGFDLTVARGSVCALLGPNGAGQPDLGQRHFFLRRSPSAGLGSGVVDILTFLL
jgi:ABC-type transporter Mla maintaining outer membrane lipid asymmetry ATPase subunit MlaF